MGAGTAAAVSTESAGGAIPAHWDGLRIVRAFPRAARRAQAHRARGRPLPGGQRDRAAGDARGRAGAAVRARQGLADSRCSSTPTPRGAGCRGRWASAIWRSTRAPSPSWSRRSHRRVCSTSCGCCPSWRASPPPCRRRSATAPCQEVVETELDLRKLPILTTWPGDGGPYITLPMVITRDPDKGTRNVGCYRMQVYDAHTTGMHWQLHKTGRRHMRRYQGARADAHAGRGGARRRSRAHLRGDGAAARRHRRVPVRRLPAPASRSRWCAARPSTSRSRRPPTSCSRDTSTSTSRVGEGPFGDHTGYYSLADDYPVFHLTALTRREDPIYPTTVVGPPPQEDAWLGKATERLFLPLLQMTFPEIVDMNLPIEGVFHNLCIVSIKKEYPHHARKICHSLWGMGQMMFAKCIVVVDDDVNVQDVREVAWRALNNIDAKRDVFFAEGPIDVLDHASAAIGLRRQAGRGRHPQVEGRGLHPRVARGPEDAARGRKARVERDVEGAGAVSAAGADRVGGGRASPSRPHRRRCATRPGPAVGVRSMFNRIARALRRRQPGDVGGDRRRLAEARPSRRLLDGLGETPRFLDLGAGTLDGALEIARRAPGRARGGRRLRARDAASRARKKLAARPPRIAAARRRRPRPALRDGAFDGAFSAFCVRNLADLPRGMRELRRVVRPGGRVVDPRVPPARAAALLLRPHLQRARAAAARLGGDRRSRRLPLSARVHRALPLAAPSSSSAAAARWASPTSRRGPLFPSGVASMVVAS